MGRRYKVTESVDLGFSLYIRTTMEEERYAFEVTWYDHLAEITRRFVLIYFVRQTSVNEVEMIDLKTNKK